MYVVWSRQKEEFRIYNLASDTVKIGFSAWLLTWHLSIPGEVCVREDTQL